jgi:hypothetical protein
MAKKADFAPQYVEAYFTWKVSDPKKRTQIAWMRLIDKDFPEKSEEYLKSSSYNAQKYLFSLCEHKIRKEADEAFEVGEATTLQAAIATLPKKSKSTKPPKSQKSKVVISENSMLEQHAMLGTTLDKFRETAAVCYNDAIATQLSEDYEALLARKAKTAKK